jgi:hypothetical protein
VIQPLIRMGLDYLRWTQIVPMVASWGFLLVTLAAMAFVSFEQQGLAIVDVLLTAWVRLGEVFPFLTPRDPETGNISLSGDDIIDIAAWIWLIASLLFAIIDWLVAGRLRIGFLSSLSRRIAAAGAAAALASAGFILVYVSATDMFNGPFVSWLPLFIGGPLLVWIVSAYSLSVSFVIGKIADLALAERAPRAV